MKKFTFTLHTLLDLNISLEKQQKNELAIINRRIQILNDEKLQKEFEITQVQIQLSEKLKTLCDVDTLSNSNRYITALNYKIRGIEELLDEQNLQRQNVQEELTKTMIKRKSLEKLKEKQYKQYLAELKTEEEKASDDFVTFSYLYG